MAGFDEFIPADNFSMPNADLSHMSSDQFNFEETPSLVDLEQQTSAYGDLSPSVKRFYQMTKSFDEKLEMVRKNQLEKLANANDYQDIIPIAYKDSDTLRVLVNGKERDLRIGSGSTMYFDAVDDLSANGKNKSDISKLRQLEQVSQLTGKYFGDITDADVKNVKNYQSTEFLRRLIDPNYKEQKYDPTTIYADPTGELQNVKLKARITGTDKHGRLVGDVLNPNTGRDLGFDMATNPYLNARFDLFGSMKGASSEAKLQAYEEGNKSIYNIIKEAKERNDYDSRLGEDIDLVKSTAYQMGARFAKLMPFTDDKYWNAIANSETGQKWADLATGVTDKTRTEFSQAGQNIQDSIAKGDYVGAVKETLLNFDRFFAESAPQMGLLAGSMIATGGLAAYGVGGAIAAKALGALPVALDKTLQDAEDFKVNNGREMTSAEYARTFAGALLTTVPEELIFGMFGGTAKGILSNILKRGVGKASTDAVAKTGAQLLRDTGKNVAAGTAGEFFQEGLETGWDTASSAKQAGRNFWSDILPEAMTSDETLAAATIGGTMGGVFAGGMQGINVAVNARTNKRLAEHLKAVDKDEMERNEEGTAASIDDSKSFMDNWKNRFTTVESVASLTPDQKHEQAEAIRDDMASANLNKKSSKYGTKLANHLDLLAWKDYHKQGLADEAIEEKLGRSKEDIFRATVFGSNLNSYELFKQNQKVSEDMQPQIEQELTELGKEMGISDEVIKKTMAEVEHDVRHGSSGYQTFTDKALRQLNKLKTESLTKEEKELLEADINGEVYSLLRLYGDQSHKIQAFTEAADGLAQGTFKGSAPVKWSKDTDKHDFTLHASNLGNNTFESGVGAYGVVGSALSDLRNIEANLTTLLNNGLSKETFNELLERYNESVDTSHKALFGDTANTLEARFRNAGNNLRIKARDEAKTRYASKQVKDIASDLQRLSNQANLDKPKAMQIMQGIHSAVTEKPELADQLKTYVNKWSNKDLKEKALKQLDNIVNLANTTASETAKAKETHDAIVDQVKSEISKLKEASVPHVYNEETDTTESINQKLGNLNSIKAQLDSWYKAFAGVASNTDEDNKIRADINSIREAVVKQYNDLIPHSQFGKPASTSSSVTSKLATFRKNLKNATNKRILSMQLGKAQKSYQKAVASNASKDEIDRLSGQVKALQDRIKELDSEPKSQATSKPKETTYTDEKGSFTVKFVPRKKLPKGNTLGVYTKDSINVADDISLSDLQSPTYRVAKALKDKLKSYNVDYDAITNKFTQKELIEYIARHERHHYLQSKRYPSHEAFMKAYNASDIDMIGFELEALILPFVDMGKVSKETAQKAIETMAKQQAEAKARKQSQAQAKTASSETAQKTPENASGSPETKGNGQDDKLQGKPQEVPQKPAERASQASLKELVGKYRTGLENAGLSREEAIAVVELLEVNAKVMAKLFGMTPEQYLSTRFAGYESMTQEEFEKKFSNALYQEAYTGGPYKFDKFSTEFISSGEGTQAHGWGMYFTSDKEMADAYRELTANGKNLQRFITLKGRHPRDLFVQAVLRYIDLPKKFESVDEFREVFRKQLEQRFNSIRRDYREIINHPDLYEEEKAYTDRIANEYWRTKHLYEMTRNEDWNIDLENYNKGPKYTGQVYKVNIPENNELLNKNLPLASQPEIVEDAINKLFTEKECNEFYEDEDLIGIDIYKKLSEKLGSDKAASLALAEHGVKGLKYKLDLEAEDNFVIFDADLISIAQTYYQKKKGQDAKGATAISNERSLIALFQGKGDVSTALHETSHFFFEEFKNAIKQGKAPEWAVKSWKAMEKQYGFTGTFDSLDENTRKELVRVQERFARDFEAYMREGKAPRPELKSTFEACKRWLKEIYKNIQSILGRNKLSPEIREVFDNLLGKQLTGAEVIRYESKVLTDKEFNEKYSSDVQQAILKCLQELYNRKQNRVGSAEFGIFIPRNFKNRDKIGDILLNDFDDFIAPFLEAKGYIKYDEKLSEENDYQEYEFSVNLNKVAELKDKNNFPWENKVTQPKPTSKRLAGSDYTNHSGGAYGSDTAWGEIGKQYGITSNHYYTGQRSENNAPNGNMALTEADAKEGVVKATKAGYAMGRLTKGQVRDPKLIRNWNQVKYADAIFAISQGFWNPGDRIGTGRNDDRVAKITQVAGGTGWAVQMAIDEKKPVYVFNQNSGIWYTYNYDNNSWEEFKGIPKLTKNFAGIGTRELNSTGIKAIASVYEATFGYAPKLRQDASRIDQNAQDGKTSTETQQVSENGSEELEKAYSGERPEVTHEQWKERVKDDELGSQTLLKTTTVKRVGSGEEATVPARPIARLGGTIVNTNKFIPFDLTKQIKVVDKADDFECLLASRYTLLNNFYGRDRISEIKAIANRIKFSLNMVNSGNSAKLYLTKNQSTADGSYSSILDENPAHRLLYEIANSDNNLFRGREGLSGELKNNAVFEYNELTLAIIDFSLREYIATSQLEDFFRSGALDKTRAASVFGLNDDSLDPDQVDALQQVVSKYGVPRSVMVNALGYLILRNMGIEENRDTSNYGFYERLAASLGAWAIDYGAELGLYELITYRPKEDTDFHRPDGEPIEHPLKAKEVQLFKINKEHFVKINAIRDEYNGTKDPNTGRRKANGLNQLKNTNAKTSTASVWDDRKIDYKDKEKKIYVRHSNGMVELSDMKRSAMQRMANTKFRIDTDITDALDKDVLVNGKRMKGWDALARTMGYLEKEEIEQLGYNDRLTAEGQNLIIMKQIETLRDAAKKQNDLMNDPNSGWSKDNWDKGIRFQQFYSTNGRLFIDSSDLNPQTLKLHRCICLAEGMHFVYDPSLAESTDPKQREEWAELIEQENFAVAQAFDSLGTREATDNFAEAMKSLTVDQLNDLRTILITNSDFNTGVFANESLAKTLTDAGIKEIGVENISQCFNTIQHLIRRQEANGKAFTTSLVVENDSTTSGYVIKMLQMPIESVKDFNGKNNILSKVGVIVDPDLSPTGVLPIHEIKKLEGFQDLYKTTASLVSDKIDTISDIDEKALRAANPKLTTADIENIRKEHRKARWKSFIKTIPNSKNRDLTENEKNHVTALSNLFVAFHDALPRKSADGKISGDFRNLMKPATMVFGYSAGFRSIANKLAGTLMREYLTTYMSIVNAGNPSAYMSKKGIDPNSDKGKKITAIYNAINRISGMYIPKKVNGKEDTFIEAIRDRAYASIYVTTGISSYNGDYKEGRKVSLEKLFQDLIGSTYGSFAGEALNTMFEPYVQINNEMVQMSTTMYQLYNRIYMNELGKLVKNDPTRSNLTSKEVAELKKKLHKFMPYITLPDSRNTGELGSDTSIMALTKFDKTRDGFNHSVNTYVGSDGKLVKGTSAYGNLYSPSNPGQSGAVIPIHGIDGSVMCNVIDHLQEGDDIVAVHDAIVMSAFKSNRISNYYNENLGLVCKDYNVYERMLIDLTRTLKLYTDYLTDEEFLDVPKEYRTKEQWEILNKDVIKTIMNDDVIDGTGKPVIEEFDRDGDHTYRTIDMLYEFVKQQNDNLLNAKNTFYAKNILISNLDAASGKGSVIMKGVTAEEVMFKEAAVRDNPTLNEDVTPVRTPEQATETLLKLEIQSIIKSTNNPEEAFNKKQEAVKNLANRINNNAKAFSSLEDFLTKTTDTLTLSSDIAYYKTLAQDYLDKFDNIRKIKDITNNYDNNKLGLLKSRLSTLTDTLEHNEQYDLVKKLNQKIKNIEKKQKTLGQDTNDYYYGSSPRGYQTNGAINNIYKAALDSTEGRVTALTDINNLARDSGNIVVSDEHMALLQSTVGCISPEHVSDWVLEVAENGEWNAGEADTARKHIQIVMDKKTNGPLLDPVTKLSALSILAPAEIYAHELMHAANDYAFTHADVFGFNSQIKQLLAIQEEASKIIKPEDFMPKAGTYDPSLQQIYERQAQDFWDYIFNNSDIHNLRGLNEFCAFIASSERLRKKLQGKSASIVVTAKPTKLVDRLIRIIKNIYDVIFGRKKFSEAFSNIYSAFKGTSSLKRVNLLEDFDRLNRELHVVTTKAINPLFEHPMKVMEHMFGLASNLIRTGNDKLNKAFFKIFNYSDIKHDNLNKQATVPDAPINATAWDRTKLFARVAKLQLTSGLQRRAMRLCLNELLGLQQQGIWLSVTRDLMGPDFDTSKLEALGLQTRMVDQNVKEQEAVTFNHLSEAFGRKLTDLENNSLTHAFLYPDTQVLWNGSNLDEVRTYLRSSDARKQDINNISSYFKNKLSKEDYSYFQYSVIGCAYNMIEGMGNPLLAMNAEAISKGLGWSNSLNLTPEEIAMVDKLITLHALENSNQDMLSVAAALPAKGLKEYLRAHQQFVKESKEGYEFQNEQGEIIKNRFIDSMHIIKGYTKQLVDPTLDCVIASPDELNPDEFKQKGYDEKASVMVNPVTRKSNVKVYTRFGIPLRRDGGIITVQGNHAMGQTLRRFAYAESDRIDELSTAHDLPAPGVNAMKLWMQYRRNADKQAIAIRNEIINRAKSGKEFTFTDFDLITAQHSTYSPIYDAGVAAPVDYRQTMSRDMKREHMGLDERGLTILSRMYGSINKQLNGNLANGVILEFLRDHQNKFMDEHHRDPKGNKFIKIEENSPNKFLRDAWRVIPQNFKDDIKANGDLWIREDWLQDLFGVPNYTLLSNEKVKQNTGYLIKRAIAIGEMIMKTIAYFRKQAIVLKIPGVLIGNIVSNLMFSLMNHKNPITVVKATIANAQAIRDYVDTRKELNRILFKQRLGTATKTEITSVNRLKSKLSQNIVAPLMAKGMYQSIVEDLQSDELESIGRVNKWLKHNKIAQKTPPWLKNTFRTVFMMEGTPAYDFMFTATQYSDFIARCTEYQLSMKEVPEEYEYAKKNGTLPISKVTNKLETLDEFKERREKEISTLVLNAFINYDKPQSQAEQYLNDLGLIMFSKFAKRIQHVIFKQLYYRPINALLFLLNQYTLVDTEDILEQNLFHKNWMNLVQNPIDNFVQSVIPMPVLIGLGYQNPW